MNYFLYRFLKDDEIIYIGKTKDLDKRLRVHFSGNGHLSHECYYETDKIEYARLKTNTEMDMLEIYYINKYSPKYNDACNYQEKDIFMNIKEVEWISFNKFNLFKAKYDLMQNDIKEINEVKKQLEILREEVYAISNKLENVYKNINKIKGRPVIPLNEDEIKEKEKINNNVCRILSVIKNNMMNELYEIPIYENVHYKIVDEKHLINFKSIWPILETYFKDEYDELMSRKDFIKMLIKSKYICGETSKHYYKTIRLSGEACKVYVCNLKDL